MGSLNPLTHISYIILFVFVSVEKLKPGNHVGRKQGQTKRLCHSNLWWFCAATRRTLRWVTKRQVFFHELSQHSPIGPTGGATEFLPTERGQRHAFTAAKKSLKRSVSRLNCHMCYGPLKRSVASLFGPTGLQECIQRACVILWWFQDRHPLA